MTEEDILNMILSEENETETLNEMKRERTTPTLTSTVAQMVAPTVTPSSTSTVTPLSTPTVAPTSTSTVMPTVAPSSTPTVAPTAASSSAPIESPHHSSLNRPNTFTGFYIMLNHIITNREDVPLYMRNSCTINERNITLAVYWLYIMTQHIQHAIHQRKVETSIPSWMHHSPDIRDSQGWTIAMHWVYKYGTDPPSWMHHDPTYQNSNGKTVAMLFFLHPSADCNSIPNWMRHNCEIFDNDGNSLIDYWISCTTLPIPPWLPPPSDYKNNNNEDVPIAYLIRRHSSPPSSCSINFNLRTSYNLTYEDLFNDSFNNAFKHIHLSDRNRHAYNSTYRYLFRLPPSNGV